VCCDVGKGSVLRRRGVVQNLGRAEKPQLANAGHGAHAWRDVLVVEQRWADAERRANSVEVINVLEA